MRKNKHIFKRLELSNGVWVDLDYSIKIVWEMDDSDIGKPDGHTEVIDDDGNVVEIDWKSVSWLK